MAGDFVVEADGVVAHADGAVAAQLGQDGVGEAVLRQPLGQAGLRHDAGEQAGFGIRQIVGSRLAVDHHRIAHLVQVEVGADAGKLGRPVQARVAAEGFVVVPEEGVCGHGVLRGRVCVLCRSFLCVSVKFVRAIQGCVRGCTERRRFGAWYQARLIEVRSLVGECCSRWGHRSTMRRACATGPLGRGRYPSVS